MFKWLVLTEQFNNTGDAGEWTNNLTKLVWKAAHIG